MSAEVSRSWPAEPLFFMSPQKLRMSLKRWPPPCLHPSLSHCLNVIWQTKRLFIQSRNKTQHPPFTLRLSNTPSKRCHLLKNTPVSSLSLFFFFNYRGQRTSHPRSKGVSQQTWQRSQSWNPSCVCVREREGVYDLCMEAMKKPIVVAPVCLISVYTTMSVVLWSPLVRLLCGALLWAEWEHRGKCRSLCVPYSSMCVIRDTHQRSRLSGCGLVFASPGELSVLDAAWFTAARPRGSRIGWRCCPVCQPGPRGVKFSLPVYFMHFNN